MLITAQIPGGSSSATIKIETETSGAITSNFGSGSSRPLIYLNDDNQGVLSFNGPEKKVDILAKIETYADQLPIVQTGIQAEFNETELVINTNSKFFQQATGDYLLGIYTVYKEIEADQSGRSGSTSTHKNVIGDELTNNPFGTDLAGGEIAKDTEVQTEIKVPLADLPELNNLIIATIVWEDLGGRFSMVNTNFTTNFVEQQQEEPQDTTTTSTGNTFRFADVRDLVVFPNGVSLEQTDRVNLQFELGQSYDDVRVQVFGLDGKQITNIFSGFLDKGIHQFSWNPTGNLNGGMYTFKLKIGGEAVVRKIILND